MAFDVEAALNGLAALVATIPSMEAVQVGAPESLSSRISTWITMGDPEVPDPGNGPEIQGVYQIRVNLILWFGYAVEGSEQAAEAQLADYLSELTRRLIQNRMGPVTGGSPLVTVTRNLNGSVDRMWLPQAAAGVADYTLMAGLETRTYPIGVRVEQRENLGV